MRVWWLAACVATAGCLTVFGGACATPPLEPIEIELDVRDDCVFFVDGSPVTITVRANAAQERIVGGLAVEGDVSGDVAAFAFDRAADKGERFELSGYLTGRGDTVVLRAWLTGADQFGGPGARGGVGAELGLRADGSTFAPDRARLGLDATIGHVPDNVTRLVATVAAPTAVNATVHLYFSWPPLGTGPPGYEPWAEEQQRYRVEGHPEWAGEPWWQGDIVRNAYLAWHGRLAAGEPLILRFDAPSPPQDGRYTVSVHVIPDPAVSTWVVADEKHLEWANGSGHFVTR